jgi:tol-pal system protein YbgF
MSFKKRIFAVIFIAFIAAVISGCCMKRDLLVLDDKINNIRTDVKENTERLNRLDSLLTAEAEASLKLRADIRSSVNELIEQARMTQANLDDLQGKMDALAGSQAPTFYQPPVTAAARDTASDDSTAAQVTPPGIDCQNLYDESFTLVMQGNYDEAISGFTDYLKYCGSQDLADNARFWIGESYYSMDNFKAAISEFDLLLSEYIDSEKRCTAMYKLARSYEELGQKQDAIAAFEKLVDDCPNTLEAEQAKDKLEELKGSG